MQKIAMLTVVVMSLAFGTGCVDALEDAVDNAGTEMAFNIVDGDNDGALTRDEWLAWSENSEAEFDAADTNGDGTLDLDEFTEGEDAGMFEASSGTAASRTETETGFTDDGQDTNTSGSTEETGTDGTGTDGTGTDGTGTDGTDGSITNPGSGGACSRSGFQIAETIAESPQNGVVLLQATNAAELPADILVVALYQAAPYYGATAPGTYDLTGTNYADCGNCIRIMAGCTQQSCEKEFYADAGSLEITSIGTSGGTFSGILHDVVAKEVTIDSQTFTSTPVQGGETWCVESLTFTAEIAGGAAGGGSSNSGASGLPVADIPAATSCVTEGTGRYIGHNIQDFSLTNCLGETVSLHQGCGKKAQWFISTAGWCPACTAQIAGEGGNPGIADTYSQGLIKTENLSDDLDIWILLFEDEYGMKPTVDYCIQYASTHKVDPSRIFIDHSDVDVDIPLADPPGYAVPSRGLATTWSYIDPYMVVTWVCGQTGAPCQDNSDCGAGDGCGIVQTFSPWHAVLRGSNMEYVWSSFYSEQDPSSLIDGLLAE